MLRQVLRTARRAGAAALIAATIATGNGCERDDLSSEREPLPVTFLKNASARWVAYAPSGQARGSAPTEEGVREDLLFLRSGDYRAVFTYGADGVLGEVPRIAKTEGYDYVVLGLWSPLSDEEYENAVAAEEYVDGYCVGNEGLLFSRYSFGDLERRVQQLRRATGKPVTTSETVHGYDERVVGICDWLFPTAHAYWQGIVDPEAAARWTADQYEDLLMRSDRPVLLKEAGLPSAGDPRVSEEGQNTFFRTLEDLLRNDSLVAFAYFEAFDQPWKDYEPVEPYWGLFDQDRVPKRAAEPQIRYTFVPARGASECLEGRIVNVRPEEYRVCTYIRVGGSWWMKPYWNRPLTAIKSDGTWETDIT
ncbi:hypothetical protein JXA12_04720, partial [Candidatus Woesearchaeota archaeon]|nr:hypothetical protein [Candidatus Woesearchaeota archaeon]